MMDRSDERPVMNKMKEAWKMAIATLDEQELEALAYYTQVCHAVFFAKLENRDGYKKVLLFVRDMGWDVAEFNAIVKEGQTNGLVVNQEFEPKKTVVAVVPSEFAG